MRQSRNGSIVKRCVKGGITISHSATLACRDSKITFHKWKVAGRPVDPNNQFYIDMKEKKKSTASNSDTTCDKT